MSYISQDSRGRIVTHPQHAKAYLEWTRRCLDHLWQDPFHHTVSLQRGFPMTLPEFKAEWRAVLDKRINLAGRLHVREPRDGETELHRDKRAIEDLLIRRTHGQNRLHTRLARKRCPDVNQRMEERLGDISC